MKNLRIIFGLLAWLAVASGLYYWLGAVDSSQRAEGRRISADLLQYATTQQPVATLQLDEPAVVAAGDPIFVVNGPGDLQQIGEIRRVLMVDPKRTAGQPAVTGAEALFYPNAPSLSNKVELTYYATPNSMTWVIETMLPPEKRQQIAEEITDTFKAHHEEILRELKPIMVAGFYDAMRVVEQDLTDAVVHRRDALEQLGSRYQQDVVQQEVVPLVRKEIWPIVREHAEPLANEMGSEMWTRASLWRFGWRYAYDKLPLTEDNLAGKEWKRFLDDDAVPVLEDHTADMVAVQQRILTEVAQNPEVRQAVRKNLARVIDDPEFRAILWQIIREVLIDNPRLRQTLEAHWRSPAAQHALALAAERTEPCVRRIGDLLFGTQQEGITPEFARVLRSQILGKDRRWFVLEPAPASEAATTAQPSSGMILTVHLGSQPEVHPFVAQLSGGER